MAADNGHNGGQGGRERRRRQHADDRDGRGYRNDKRDVSGAKFGRQRRKGRCGDKTTDFDRTDGDRGFRQHTRRSQEIADDADTVLRPRRRGAESEEPPREIDSNFFK